MGLARLLSCLCNCETRPFSKIEAERCFPALEPPVAEPRAGPYEQAPAVKVRV